MAGLRVIAGKAKGRRLEMVPGDTTRPIPDRVKEALFNIIGLDIRGAWFLDIFSGTGSVGIEALSRGAEWGTFFERDRKALLTLRNNLKLTQLEQSAEVIPGDAFQIIANRVAKSFDYLFIAPPQYKELWKKTVQALDETTEWMNPDAWAIVQIHPKEYEALTLKHLQEFDQRKYGNTLLVFYEFTSD